MAKAKLVTLADEVKDKVSTLLKVNATRTYKPNPKLEDTDHLTVLVVMAGSRFTWDTRDHGLYEHDIDVGILYRGGEQSGVPTEKFDECMKMVQDVADYWRFTRPTLSDMPLFDVTYGGPSGAIYIPEHINEFNQFTGVVRLTFREWRT